MREPKPSNAQTTGQAPADAGEVVEHPKLPSDRMLAAMGCTDLTPTERLVFAAVAQHDGPGGAHPSAARIAGALGLSRGAVFAHIKACERKGRLKRRRGKHANHYGLRYGPPPQCREIPDSENRGHSVGKSGATVSGDSRHEGKKGNLSAPPAQKERFPPVSSNAPSRPAPPERAERAGATDERYRKKPAPPPPRRTLTGPCPYPGFALVECAGPCNSQRWAPKAGPLFSDCRVCGTRKGHSFVEPPQQNARQDDHSQEDG